MHAITVKTSGVMFQVLTSLAVKACMGSENLVTLQTLMAYMDRKRETGHTPDSHGMHGWEERDWSHSRLSWAWMGRERLVTFQTLMACMDGKRETGHTPDSHGVHGWEERDWSHSRLSWRAWMGRESLVTLQTLMACMGRESLVTLQTLMACMGRESLVTHQTLMACMDRKRETGHTPDYYGHGLEERAWSHPRLSWHAWMGRESLVTP